MQKNKKLAYLLVLALAFSSCGEYSKVLNKGTVDSQYKMAVKMYESKKYSKALRLFEKVTPKYRNKPQMERLQYMVANANLNNKSYALAGYYFNRFTQNYPKSSKREEAKFLSALGYYKAAPTFSLDSKDTHKALEAFQAFINEFPDSKRLDEANTYYKSLRRRLDKKEFEIAKTYYRTADYDYRNYKAAIVAFDNLLSDNLGTEFKEEALFLRFKAAHDYALKSTKRRKAKRLAEAVKAFQKLNRNFPNSQFKEEANDLLATIKKEQGKIENTVKG